MSQLRDIPSELLSVAYHRCVSPDLTGLFASPYEVQTSHMQSTTCHMCPKTKRVVRVKCSLYYAYNEWARYWNLKSDVKQRSYLIPLKRTLPWIMGSDYTMGEEPMYLSAGGLFPDNISTLLTLNDKQLDDLEGFYGQKFIGKTTHQRIGEFKGFIQQSPQLKYYPDLIAVHDSFWWTNPWVEEQPFGDWDGFHNGSTISTWLFRFPNPDNRLRR